MKGFASTPVLLRVRDDFQLQEHCEKDSVSYTCDWKTSSPEMSGKED